MSKFKVGDKVRCKDVSNKYSAKPIAWLKLGEIYTVKAVQEQSDGTHLKLEEVARHSPFAHRFELAQAKRAPAWGDYPPKPGVYAVNIDWVPDPKLKYYSYWDGKLWHWVATEDQSPRDAWRNRTLCSYQPANVRWLGGESEYEEKEKDKYPTRVGVYRVWVGADSSRKLYAYWHGAGWGPYSSTPERVSHKPYNPPDFFDRWEHLAGWEAPEQVDCRVKVEKKPPVVGIVDLKIKVKDIRVLLC